MCVLKTGREGKNPNQLDVSVVDLLPFGLASGKEVVPSVRRGFLTRGFTCFRKSVGLSYLYEDLS